MQSSESLKRDYISKNTFLLSPSLVREYLIRMGLLEEKREKPEEESKTLKEDINAFLHYISQNPSKEDFLKVLANNPKFIDLFATLFLESYELLYRVLTLIDIYYAERKIKDNELIKCVNSARVDGLKSLPKTSIELKGKIIEKKSLRLLLAYLFYRMFYEDFGKYFLDNICNGEFKEFLAKSLSQFCERAHIIKEIIETCKTNFEMKTLVEILTIIYLSESRGARKAKEGIEYQEVLKEVLDFHGIPHEMEIEEEGEEEMTRNWDLYIPSKSSPRIVIEVMYSITTSSGMTNKRKVIIDEAEKGGERKIFVLMDGAGWVARWSDARKILGSNVFTFTFHKESLSKALEKIKEILNQR